MCAHDDLGSTPEIGLDCATGLTSAELTLPYLWVAAKPCDSHQCVELLATAVLSLALAPAPVEVPEPTVEAPPTSWLEWNAPDTCPTAEYLEEATEARLGRAPEPGEVAVQADIEDRGADGLQLTLETTRQGQTDSHTMTAHDCMALADASALVVALSIDPVAVATNVRTAGEVAEQPEPPTLEQPSPILSGPEPELEPEPEPRPEPDVGASDRPTDDEPVDRRPTELLLAATGGIELGAHPGVTGGPNVALALAWRRLRLEVGGWFLAPRTTDRDGANVRVLSGAAAARGCGRLHLQRVEVPLCAGFEAGGTRGDGSGAPNPRDATGLWLAPIVASGVHAWVIPRLAIVGRIEVAVPIMRTAFEVRDPGDPVELFRPEPVSGRIWIGIEGKLWGRRDGSGGGRRNER